MAKNVTVQGASYPDVPAIDVPQTGGGTARFIDPSDTTATAPDVASGKYFYGADGVLTLGTASGGGGGGSSWTKVCEKSYQISTASTSAETVESWGTGHSELWTSDKIVYIRVRDTAGKRVGYFYGTDNYFVILHPINNSSTTSTSSGIRHVLRYDTSGLYQVTYGSGTTGYGVYADYVYSSGEIRIRSRYNSGSSLTIDGTYKVEVYLIDPPFTIFE